ncbi:MAG: transporter [Oceanospirillales bacterium]|nr:MAG: transporter [Oceanospirillales bacterium]
MKYLQFIYAKLRNDRLLTSLILALLLLLLMMPTEIKSLHQLVDWKTIAILTGLMLLSRGLEYSGALSFAGDWLLSRTHTQRQLAFSIIIFSALLAAIVTNDVALFIVVPLTILIGRYADIPVGKLIIFEALAVNAGSAISPIGNPQNLYLWQLSGDGFLAFTLEMLPIAFAMLCIVLLLASIAFNGKRIEIAQHQSKRLLSKPLFLIVSISYPIFLLVVEQGFAVIAAIMVLILFLILWRKLLLTVDWLILLVFVLMFIVLGLLAKLPAMTNLVDNLMDLPGAEITTSILLSQVISNVPATLFLSQFSDQWYALAWGVNIGGFGLAIGSLANLIALRLGKEYKIFWNFHLWSMPCLFLSMLICFILL